MKFLAPISLFCLIFNLSGANLDPKIVETLSKSIKIQENSKKFPYGIRSIKIIGKTQQEREDYCKKVCENTIRNNFRRWGANHENQTNFINYLSEKYCPSSVDPTGNKNWRKNIKKISKLDF